MLKPGWLKRQFEKVEEDVKQWPTWMRREAGFENRQEHPPVGDQPSIKKAKISVPEDQEED